MPLSEADAGKKVNGRKRHIITNTIITNTEGHLVGLTVHTADIQDRDGAVGVIAPFGSFTRGCAICSPTAATPVKN